MRVRREVHAFVDEATRQDYLLCVSMVPVASLATLRRDVHGLRPRGSSRIHMTSIHTAERSRVVSGIAALDVSSRLYVVGKSKVTGRQARDIALEKMIHDLASLGVRRLMIESCSQDSEDRRIIGKLRPPGVEFHFDVVAPSTDSLLWIPDVHAWAWGRGGSMRAKVSHQIEVIRL